MIEIPDKISDLIMTNIMNRKFEGEQIDPQKLLFLQTNTTILKDFIQPMSYMLQWSMLTEFGRKRFIELKEDIVDYLMYNQLYILGIDIEERPLSELINYDSMKWHNIAKELNDFKKNFVNNTHLIICMDHGFRKINNTITTRASEITILSHGKYLYQFPITCNILKENSILSITTTLTSSVINGQNDLFWTFALYKDNIPICKQFLDDDMPDHIKMNAYINDVTSFIYNVMSGYNNYFGDNYVKKYKQRLIVLRDVFDEDSIEQIKRGVLDELNNLLTRFDEKQKHVSTERYAICMNILHEVGIISDEDTEQIEL